MHISKNDLKFERCTIDGISTLSCFKTNAGKKTLIILSHAFWSTKEYWQARLETFAELGYYSVALDNKGHGQRREPDFKERVFIEGRLNVYEVRRLIKETADDVPKLINHFVAKEQVDAARIGMIGVSMGGFITYRAIVIEERIRVAVPIIASPYFDDVPRDVPAVNQPEIQQALKAYSREYSPAHYLDRFYPRAILIQIGGLDKHINGKRVARFYRELTSYYQETPDKLEFVVEENAAHEFTAGMWDKALNWFQKHL
jgi:cephalosporin-C deacetylase-like acetyl esterase